MTVASRYDIDFFQLPIQLKIENAGPDTATNISIVQSTSYGGTQPSCLSPRTLAPGASIEVSCGVFPLRTPGVGQISVAVIADQTDPNPSDNRVTRDVTFYAAPRLNLTPQFSSFYLDAGAPFTLTVFYLNVAQTIAATGVTVDIEMPAGVRYLSGPAFCSSSGSHITCSLGTLEKNTTDSMKFQLMTPDDLRGVDLAFRASIFSNETGTGEFKSLGTARMYRTFVVENANDRGAGSLREAMLTANATCTDFFPCKIDFRIAETPASGFNTIAPITPLPAITAFNVSIDGATQTRRAGETNPDGPEIFIDGAQTSEGFGFHMDGCAGEIRGFAIGNFRSSAIQFTQSNCKQAILGTVADNYIGVDPSGVRAAANERGVVTGSPLYITGNIISGNRRSGVWIDRGGLPTSNGWQTNVSVSKNKIGLDRNLKPMPNGASGIYMNARATVVDNFIAFNHDFGIAIPTTNTDADIRTNSIFANWQLAIDVGLDGPSPNSGVKAPEIRSARYDAATDTTLIEFVRSPDGNQTNLWASDAPHRTGFGEGQFYLGVSFGSPVTFKAAGDWRGKWVSGTATRFLCNCFGATVMAPDYDNPHYMTSEFSRAVKVE
jgi:hypothetical protein